MLLLLANIHNISPQDAHIIASRYSQGVPLSEIVNIQANLAQSLENLTLNRSRPTKLPNMQPVKSTGLIETESQNASSPASKFKDINHSWYSTSSPARANDLNAQYSEALQSNVPYLDGSKGTKFNPALTPGQFLNNSPPSRGKDAPNIPGYNSSTHPFANRKGNDQYGFENPYFNQKHLPEYSPFKHRIQSETQDPQSPKTVKDLMYSTYDAAKRPAAPNQIDRDYDVSQTHRQADGFLGNRQFDPLIDDFNQSVRKKLCQFEPRTGNLGPEYYGYPDDLKGQGNPPIKTESEEGSVPHRNMAFDSLDPNTLNQTQSSSNKMRGPLSLREPRQLNVREEHLEPCMVNVGPIQDINPEIKAATTELNPGFDRDSDNCSDFSPENVKDILGDIKLPDCHYCKKPFQENEFAITIDRASALFHAPCFRCAGCNQNLADNIYFYHKETDNVYCGRDYAKIKGYPRCSACDELIFTKEYCLAEDATFHLKHFCCFQCDVPLAGQDYTLEDEKPYCLPCYETSKAATCNACEKIIKPDERGCQLNGVHFHAEDRCFSCTVCKVPLMGKKLLLRNDKLFCSHACFNGSNN